jgi:hypothetical protein
MLGAAMLPECVRRGHSMGGARVWEEGPGGGARVCGEGPRYVRRERPECVWASAMILECVWEGC